MKFTSASASLLVVVFSLAAVVPTTGQRQQRLSVRHLQDFADETVDSMSFSGKPLALMSIAGIEGDPLSTKSKTSKSKASKSKSEKFECVPDAEEVGREGAVTYPVCEGMNNSNYCDGGYGCISGDVFCNCAAGIRFCNTQVNPCTTCVTDPEDETETPYPVCEGLDDSSYCDGEDDCDSDNGFCDCDVGLSFCYPTSKSGKENPCVDKGPVQ
mmetsp:Transcript_27725/g.66787  ORF Transcript_27725/g.66787 Transcript_27725/m.66787 type:complete len:213 (+) Transcript_27725:181-819(+)